MRTAAVLVLCLLRLHSSAQNDSTATCQGHCLMVKGFLEQRARREEPYTVELISAASRDTIAHGCIRRFRIQLSCNGSYAILISRPGYYPRLISIDSHMPPHGNPGTFIFSTGLQRQTKKLNPEAYDFPIAVIRYDAQRKMFHYNRAYTQRIRKEMVSLSDRGTHAGNNHRKTYTVNPGD